MSEPDFSDTEQLREWLETQPPVFSVVIASRAALRSIMFALDQHQARSHEFRTALSLIFRAVAVSWSTAHNPPKDAKRALADQAEASAAAIRPAAYKVNPASKSSLFTLLSGNDYILAVARSAAYAASSANFPNRSVDIGLSVEYASTLGISATTHAADARALLTATSDDAVEDAAHSVAGLPIWPQRDEAFAERWRAVEAALRGEAPFVGMPQDQAEELRETLRAEKWSVWIDWYEKRLRGGEWNEAWELERVLSDTIPWDGSVREINEALAAIDAKYEAPKPPPAEPLASPIAKSRAESLLSLGEEAQATLTVISDDILEALDAYHQVTGINERPEELERVAAAARRMRAVADAVESQEVEALKAEIAALKLEIEALKTPQQSAFWASFKAEHGKQTAVTLHKAIRWGVGAGALYIFGPDIGAKLLPELAKAIGK